MCRIVATRYSVSMTQYMYRLTYTYVCIHTGMHEQVGVGIAGDSSRMMRDYTEQLSSSGGVAGMIELSHMAATR
jgi:hypothetical protein